MPIGKISYSIDIFLRLATKLVHMTRMSIFEKVRFRCRDERLKREKKICFPKYEDTCGQDQSQLSVARVPILCFRIPHNTLCLPPLPLPKKSHKLLFSNAPGRTAYSLDQEHLKTTTYAKFRGVNRLYYKGLKLLE